MFVRGIVFNKLEDSIEIQILEVSSKYVSEDCKHLTVFLLFLGRPIVLITMPLVTMFTWLASKIFKSRLTLSNLFFQFISVILGCVSRG